MLQFKTSDNKSFTLINKTKGRLPSLPFVSIKEKILGKKYDLSLVFLTSAEQKKINNKYRKINKTTNILSFELDKNSGEITIDILKVKEDAPSFDMDFKTFLKLLLIHGCLHLKGFKHSDTMDKEEEKFLKFFS